MPPPVIPLEIPSDDDWKRCKRDLTNLPDDYKDFLMQYGSGVVDDFLRVFNPAAENEHLNLISQAKIILSALEESSRNFPDMFSMPSYPATNGFLPFASTDNGDNIFWVVNGQNPNLWTIAVMGPRSPEVFRHESGFVEFLVAMIRSDIRCKIFPSDFPDAPPISFVATRE
ncbi:SMI1/KNR4 family protein [Symmachiella dynata]|nr:SMI1/KNR4 family protein [Symmachiella dynata]